MYSFIHSFIFCERPCVPGVLSCAGSTAENMIDKGPRGGYRLVGETDNRQIRRVTRVNKDSIKTV